jgi:hypothetical protein
MNQNLASDAKTASMNNPPLERKRSGFLKTLGIILVTAIVSVAITFWVLTTTVFPSNFNPVKLSAAEQTALETKLVVFEGWGVAPRERNQKDAKLQPEIYNEQDADREIALSERELNGILANNSDIANRLVIDLSENLASARLLIPLDEDFPIMGGRNLKLSAGLELAYTGEQPVVVLKGVSVMGVPLPGAWLGGLKNVDLVKEFGGDAGFWKAFADGVEFVRIEQGRLVIKLKQ